MSLETPSTDKEKNSSPEGQLIKFNRYLLKENLAKTEAHADILVKAYLSKN